MKAAIIKTGRHETFHEQDPGSAISLGDVLRTTPVLHALPEHEIHWFTSPEARPLLDGIERIAALHTSWNGGDLPGFDLIVNLERGVALRPGEATLGFVRNQSGEPLLRARNDSRLHSIQEWKDRHIAQGKPLWQHWLYAMLGLEWEDERYLIPGIAPAKESQVGLNWQVGSKWPGKAIPRRQWEELAGELAKDFSVSWQRGFDQLPEYLRWIASCELIITHDSLGLHLALAMKRKVIALFGSTHSEEIHLYGLGEKILEPSPRAIASAVRRLIPG